MTVPCVNEDRHGAALDSADNPKLWGWHTVLSIAATAAILAVLASYVDLAQVRREITASDKGLLFLAALSHYATYPVRGARWRRCLRHVPGRCGNARFGLLAFFFLFVDNVIPAKLGDVYGAHLARINCGVRRSAALGSIVFQRTVDAWMVLLLAVSASWYLFSSSMPRAVIWALIVACLFAVTATAVIAVFSVKYALPSWVSESLRQRIAAFRTGMLPELRELVPVLLLSVIIWALESLWLFLLLRSFGQHIGAGEAVFLMAIPVIATVFPFTPSGAGAVELTLFGSLRLIGIASPLAVSLTVVNRFIDFWMHIILGTLIWLLRARIGLRTWKDLPADGPGPTIIAANKEVVS